MSNKSGEIQRQLEAYLRLPSASLGIALFGYLNQFEWNTLLAKERRITILQKKSSWHFWTEFFIWSPNSGKQRTWRECMLRSKWECAVLPKLSCRLPYWDTAARLWSQWECSGVLSISPTIQQVQMQILFRWYIMRTTYLYRFQRVRSIHMQYEIVLCARAGLFTADVFWWMHLDEFCLRTHQQDFLPWHGIGWHQTN